MAMVLDHPLGIHHTVVHVRNYQDAAVKDGYAGRVCRTGEGERGEGWGGRSLKATPKNVKKQIRS